MELFNSNQTKSGTTKLIQTIQYIVSYPNCKFDIISYSNTSNNFSSVKSQQLPQQKFGGAQRRNSKITFAVQVYKLFSIYFFALTFEPNINIANLFFAPFLFPRKTEQINCKKYTVKKSKMIFHDFFFFLLGVEANQFTSTKEETKLK